MEIPNLAVVFILILFFNADDSFVDVLCIVFHEQNFVKMKISDEIKVLYLALRESMENDFGKCQGTLVTSENNRNGEPPVEPLPLLKQMVLVTQVK